MIKSKDELAREYADKVHPLALDVELGFQAGFHAGYARAVELLRSQAAIDFSDKTWQIPLGRGNWADWLEKQEQ